MLFTSRSSIASAPLLPAAFTAWGRSMITGPSEPTRTLDPERSPSDYGPPTASRVFRKWVGVSPWSFRAESGGIVPTAPVGGPDVCKS